MSRRSRRGSRRARARGPLEMRVPAPNGPSTGSAAASGSPPGPVARGTRKKRSNAPQLGGGGARRERLVGRVREEHEPVPAARVARAGRASPRSARTCPRDARRDVEHDDAVVTRGQVRASRRAVERGHEREAAAPTHPAASASSARCRRPARRRRGAPRRRAGSRSRRSSPLALGSVGERRRRPPASGCGRDQATRSALVGEPLPRARSPPARGALPRAGGPGRSRGRLTQEPDARARAGPRAAPGRARRGRQPERRRGARRDQHEHRCGARGERGQRPAAAKPAGEIRSVAGTPARRRDRRRRPAARPRSRPQRPRRRAPVGDDAGGRERHGGPRRPRRGTHPRPRHASRCR